MGLDGGDWDIFLYDGNSVKQLTDNDLYEATPQINDLGQAVWQAELIIVIYYSEHYRGVIGSIFYKLDLKIFEGIVYSIFPEKKLEICMDMMIDTDEPELHCKIVIIDIIFFRVHFFNQEIPGIKRSFDCTSAI